MSLARSSHRIIVTLVTVLANELEIIARHVQRSQGRKATEYFRYRNYGIYLLDTKRNRPLKWEDCKVRTGQCKTDGGPPHVCPKFRNTAIFCAQCHCAFQQPEKKYLYKMTTAAFIMAICWLQILHSWTLCTV